jgi:hypothetical protein
MLRAATGIQRGGSGGAPIEYCHRHSGRKQSPIGGPVSWRTAKGNWLRREQRNYRRSNLTTFTQPTIDGTGEADDTVELLSGTVLGTGTIGSAGGWFPLLTRIARARPPARRRAGSCLPRRD